MVDPSLMEMVIEKSTDTIRWMVKKQNIKMELTSNFVHRIDGRLHFVGELPISAKGAGAGLSDFLFSELERKGIKLRYETGAEKLLVDAKGCVVGVTAKSKNGFEDIEVTTGRREEGLLLATRTFSWKAVVGAGTFVAGIVLAAIGFPVDAKPGDVDPHTIFLLGLVAFVLIAGLFFVAFLFVTGYNVSRLDHEENLTKLGSRQGLRGAGKE